MTDMWFLTILLVVTCVLGGVVSVTDKEFEVHIRLYLRLCNFLDPHYLIHHIGCCDFIIINYNEAVEASSNELINCYAKML